MVIQVDNKFVKFNPVSGGYMCVFSNGTSFNAGSKYTFESVISWVKYVTKDIKSPLVIAIID